MEVFPQYVGVLEERTASIPSSGLEMDEEFTETSVSSYPITRCRITEEYNLTVDCSFSHVR
jgi:hypothetical protein